MNPDEAKNILGKSAVNLSYKDIQNIITKFEYLAEGFLDNYEKQIFQSHDLHDNGYMCSINSPAVALPEGCFYSF